MKKLALLLGLFTASLTPVFAQVTVEVLLDQDQYLPGEALVAAVRITNRSGQQLRLGAEPDWLTFVVESGQAGVVPKVGEPPVEGEFTLESSEMATKRVNLAPWFSLGQPGRYGIIATVKIKEWGRDIASPSKAFYLIEGAKIWEQEFGVPKAADSATAAPELRKYILQQANYIKGHLRLYLRITEAPVGKAIRVFPIGPMLSFSRPEPRLDKLSNLHVLYQNGPHSYSYTTINPDGEVLVRQTYDYITLRPRLRENDDGTISVIGGVRRVTRNDVPPPKPPGPSGNTPPPEPPATPSK